MLASVEAVDPLPLVPAMRTERNCRCGIAERGHEGAHLGELELAPGLAGGGV